MTEPMYPVPYLDALRAWWQLHKFFYGPQSAPNAGKYGLIYRLLTEVLLRYSREGLLADETRFFSMYLLRQLQQRGWIWVDEGRGLLVPQPELIQHILHENFGPCHYAEMYAEAKQIEY